MVCELYIDKAVIYKAALNLPVHSGPFGHVWSLAVKRKEVGRPVLGEER